MSTTDSLLPSLPGERLIILQGGENNDALYLLRVRHTCAPEEVENRMEAAVRAFLNSTEGQDAAIYDPNDDEPWQFYWWQTARELRPRHWAAFGLSVEELTDDLLVLDADENLADFLTTRQARPRPPTR